MIPVQPTASASVGPSVTPNSDSTPPGGNGAYSLFSGAAHSEFWSLLGGYQGGMPSPLGVSATEHQADSESHVPLVRACLQALFKPIDYACAIFDRPALAKDIKRMYDQAVGLLGTTASA